MASRGRCFISLFDLILQAEAKLKDKTIEAVRDLVNGIEGSGGRARSLRSRTSRSTGQLELSTTSSESDIPTAAASAKSDVLSPRSVKSRFMSTPVLHNTIHVNPPSTGRRVCFVRYDMLFVTSKIFLWEISVQFL